MLRSLTLVGIAALAACPAPVAPPPQPPAPPPVVAPVTPPPAAAPAALSPPEPTLRLPTNFTPTGYTARLAIDPAQPGFSGDITIAGTVNTRSARLWLHGRHLAITTITAQRDGAEPIAVGVTPHGDDLLELKPAQPLDAGAWTLHFVYRGDYNDLETAGVFRQTVAGERYVYSQLESIYARRVWPCFDEPSSKVPWQLTLDVPTGLVAVSNTPESSRTAIDATHVRIAFAPTPPLPSYLVAFGVGPFEILDAGHSKAGVPIRVITLKGRTADAMYAVKTTPAILDALTDYFQIPYPYPKVDLLTIPLTVGFGAMENAGLVTFSENYMLFDQQHPAARRQHSWITVAGHELAHQWFGDYVTTAWWDDIWLNEGFANWMEKKITATLQPAWHEELSELDERDSALSDDGLTSGRKIRQPITTQDDIDTAFDGITYDKGASVLNMFESYVGRDTFQKGVRAYLTSRAFGNATSTDFVDAINTASGKDLTRAFASFLDQPGAPSISATIACDRGARVKLAQQRYVPVGAGKPEGAAQLWTVPVCVAYDKDGARGEACTMLDAATAELALPSKACPRWVMGNVNGRGYFHIAPTAAQVVALRDEAWSQLSWTERRALVTDVDEAVTSGRMPLALGLSFVPKLLAGGDRFTIGDALGLPLAVSRVVPDEQRAKYEAWLRMTFGAGAAQVGLVPKDSDDLDTQTTRAQLIATVAGVGRDPALVAEAVKLAPSWRELPQAVRGEILEIAVDANAEMFERTLKEVTSEPVRSNRQAMIAALASVRDVPRHGQALVLVLDKNMDIRETGEMVLFARTNATRDASQQFFRAHQAEILARVPHDDTTSEAVGLASLFTETCDAARRDEIVAYVHTAFDALPGAKRGLAEEIEGMDQCIARRKLIEPEVRGWLNGVKIPKPDKPPPSPSPSPSKSTSKLKKSAHRH